MGTEFGVESPAFIAIRLVLSIGTIGLLGILALRWAVLPRYTGPDPHQLRTAIHAQLPRWIFRCGVVAVIATLARLVAQHAAVFGVEERLSRDSLAPLLFRSGWGRMWWIALVAALLVIWVARRLHPSGAHSTSRPWWFVAAASILTFAASQPLSGHPAAAATPSIAIATQLLHLLGAGGWVGSLALLTLLAIPTARTLEGSAAVDSDARIAGLVRAFSPTALACAALLAVTGLVTAWANVGGIAPLWQSAYGRTLLFKLGALSAVGAIGAYNWRRVLPTLGQPIATARLRRSSLMELSAALLVLGATAVLVATPMPGE